MSNVGSQEFSWKSVRVELVESPEFPHGSASRAYMLHLPLRADGTVDEGVLRENPTMAGFRRFWPNEPDRSGFVVPAEDGGWALRFQTAMEGFEGRPFSVRLGRLLPGDRVTISRPDRSGWLFRVVEL